MKKVLLPILTALMAASAYGNLGDTMDQIIAVWGQPTERVADNMVIWKRENWSIAQVFNSKGYSDFILYVRLDGKEISKLQADAMDKMNHCADLVWKEMGPINDHLTAYSNDKGDLLMTGTATEFGGNKAVRSIATREGAEQLRDWASKQ
jgi:hypothetical protein